MRHPFRYFACLTILALAGAGCSSDNSPPTPPQKSAQLANLPAEMTVKQRSTTDVPGSEGALRLTIDDITGGQVIASLLDEHGRAVLGPTSLKDGTSAAFQWGEETYRLTLREFNNSLVGDDFATFVFSIPTMSPSPALPPSGRESMSEREKIERLLSAVEAAEGDVFIRNGVEHSAKEAAEHLRAKWRAGGAQITTAEEIIDKIGTKSSITGAPYRVRRADGREVPAGDYLREKLHEIEGELRATDNRLG